VARGRRGRAGGHRGALRSLPPRQHLPQPLCVLCSRPYADLIRGPSAGVGASIILVIVFIYGGKYVFGFAAQAVGELIGLVSDVLP
jgi:hypothetical protein